jgi:hypothetical protein
MISPYVSFPPLGTDHVRNVAPAPVAGVMVERFGPVQPVFVPHAGARFGTHHEGGLR